MDNKQKVIEKQNSTSQKDNLFGKKILVIFLYFIQGIFLSLAGTITLTYKQIPSYAILGYFSIAYIPFSLKFISAPLIEKYSFQKYGRRKTWAVISLIVAGLLLVRISPLSMIDTPDSQIQLALLFTLVIFFISLQDISVDALSVKELQSSELAGYYQCLMQPIGGAFGSLIMLELVTDSMSNRLGYSEPILTVEQFLKIVAYLTIIGAILIHFLYKETVTKEEEQGVPHSLWQVVKHYKHFFQPRYRMCRQAIVFFLSFHGLIYFSSSYSVELIKNNHVSKQVLTSLSNFMLIPNFLLTNILGKYWNDGQKVHKRWRRNFGFRLLLMVVIFFLGIKDQYLACASLLILSMLSICQFFLNTMIINGFSNSKFSGMYITMISSIGNFGNNSTIQLKLIDQFGYQKAVIFGFVYAFFTFLLLGKLEKWIKSGEIQKDIQSKNKKL